MFDPGRVRASGHPAHTRAPGTRRPPAPVPAGAHQLSHPTLVRGNRIWSWIPRKLASAGKAKAFAPISAIEVLYLHSIITHACEPNSNWRMQFMLPENPFSRIHQSPLGRDDQSSHREPVVVKTNGCPRGETGEAGTRAAPAGFHCSFRCFRCLQLSDDSSLPSQLSMDSVQLYLP